MSPPPEGREPPPPARALFYIFIRPGRGPAALWTEGGPGLPALRPPALISGAPVFTSPAPARTGPPVALNCPRSACARPSRAPGSPHLGGPGLYSGSARGPRGVGRGLWGAVGSAARGVHGVLALHLASRAPCGLPDRTRCPRARPPVCDDVCTLCVSGDAEHMYRNVFIFANAGCCVQRRGAAGGRGGGAPCRLEPLYREFL